MSHLRPSDRVGKHRRSDCKRGRHLYGESTDIGAGITRQVCSECGAVTIDLSGASELTEPIVLNGKGLFSKLAQRTEAS